MISALTSLLIFALPTPREKMERLFEIQNQIQNGNRPYNFLIGAGMAGLATGSTVALIRNHTSTGDKAWLGVTLGLSAPLSVLFLYATFRADPKLQDQDWYSRDVTSKDVEAAEAALSSQAFLTGKFRYFIAPVQLLLGGFAAYGVKVGDSAGVKILNASLATLLIGGAIQNLLMNPNPNQEWENYKKWRDAEVPTQSSDDPHWNIGIGPQSISFQLQF